MSGGEGVLVAFAALVALALGLAVGWLWAAARERARGEARPRELEAQLREVEPKLREAEGTARAAQATAEELRRSLGVAEDRSHRLEQELGETQKARAVAETQAVELRRNLDEQKALLDSAEVKLGDTFRALAAQALAANNEGFLTLATEKLTAARKASDDTLAARQTAIDGLLKPVKESLDKVDTKIIWLKTPRPSARRARNCTDAWPPWSSIGPRSARLSNAQPRASTRLRLPSMDGSGPPSESWRSWARPARRPWVRLAASSRGRACSRQRRTTRSPWPANRWSQVPSAL
jgi:hypothetical protein